VVTPVEAMPQLERPQAETPVGVMLVELRPVA
jgi:hypothetical protein